MARRSWVTTPCRGTTRTVTAEDDVEKMMIAIAMTVAMTAEMIVMNGDPREMLMVIDVEEEIAQSRGIGAVTVAVVATTTTAAHLPPPCSCSPIERARFGTTRVTC